MHEPTRSGLSGSQTSTTLHNTATGHYTMVNTVESPSSQIYQNAQCLCGTKTLVAWSSACSEPCNPVKRKLLGDTVAFPQLQGTVFSRGPVAARGKDTLEQKLKKLISVAPSKQHECGCYRSGRQRHFC